MLLLVILRIAKAQNIGNLTGREEYNIDHFLLSVPILFSLTKPHPAPLAPQAILDFRGGQKLKMNY